MQWHPEASVSVSDLQMIQICDSWERVVMVPAEARGRTRLTAQPAAPYKSTSTYVTPRLQLSNAPMRVDIEPGHAAHRVLVALGIMYSATSCFLSAGHAVEDITAGMPHVLHVAVLHAPDGL